MPTITVMPQGIKAAFPGGNPSPVKRGAINGLTSGSARRCMDFLRSIDPTRLTGETFTYTFTVKDIPPTAKEWDRMKRALFMRFQRLGVLRHHHVTEWQRRGAPHLHGVAFFAKYRSLKDDDFGVITKRISAEDLKVAWLAVSKDYGSHRWSQDVRHEKAVSGAWFRYMSKHASRGVNHYQRQTQQIPPGWTTTGRMWGKHGGDWPTRSDSYEIEPEVFHSLRRMVRRYRRSQALSVLRKPDCHTDLELKQARATLAFVRSLKQITCPRRSATLPVSEWIEPQLVADMLAIAHENL